MSGNEKEHCITVEVKQVDLCGYLIYIVPRQLGGGYCEKLPFCPQDVVKGLNKKGCRVAASDTGGWAICITSGYLGRYYFPTKEMAEEYQEVLVEWINGEGSKKLRRRVEEALRKDPSAVRRVADLLGIN